MFLKSFALDGNPQRIEIQTNVAALIVKTTMTTVVQETGATPGVLTALVGNWGNTFSQNLKCTISRYSPSGSEVLFQNVPFAELAEILAFGKSVIRHDLFGGSRVESTCLIWLSNAGALRCDKNEFIVIEFNTTTVAGAQVTINSLSSYVSVDEAVTFNAVGMTAAQTSKFDVSGSYLLALPKSVEKIALRGSTGETIEMNRTELNAYQYLTADEIHEIHGVNVPSMRFDVVDCAMARTAEVVPSANGVCYMLQNKYL